MMTDKEIEELRRSHQAIVNRYGYEIVPVATVYRNFEEIAAPTGLGFSAIKTGQYARDIHDGIVHLMKLQHLKGGAFSVWWGVSLAYIPHAWNSGLRWHRSLKAAQFDLFETPGDYFAGIEADWREIDKHYAIYLHGEVYLRETMTVMWTVLRKIVLDWFSSTQSLDDVLAKAYDQMERKWTGPHHLPNPKMVYAFTLGRLRHREEARSTLESFLQSADESVEAQANLRKALEKISVG